GGGIVLAWRDDRIGCVSRGRQLVVCALHERLLHANAGGGLGANARAEGAVVQHGCADLEQCRAAIRTGCGTQGADGSGRRRPDCRRPLRLYIPGRAALHGNSSTPPATSWRPTQPTPSFICSPACTDCTCWAASWPWP